MGKNNTFLEYLGTDRFYDKIHGSIFSWCTQNKELLLIKLRELVQIELQRRSVMGPRYSANDLFSSNLYVDLEAFTVGKNGIQEAIMKSLFINAIISFTKGKINA